MIKLRRYGPRVADINNPRSARAIIREHLRNHNLTIKNDLSKWWEVKSNAAERMMYHKTRQLRPEHIEAVIAALSLDDFDSLELRMAGAREAGWIIKEIT